MSIDKAEDRTIPCNHTAAPVGPEFCKHTSNVPARAGACAGCTSPHRNLSTKAVADPEDGLQSSAKRFEGLGVTALSSQHSAANFSATGGGTPIQKVGSSW